jgi:hypothetical protein
MRGAVLIRGAFIDFYLMQVDIEKARNIPGDFTARREAI